MVRFGTDGRWINRTVSNYVQCDNDAFGDPAPGAPKRCQVRVSGNYGTGNYGGSNYGSGYNPGSAQGWSFCAAEGEICRVKGRTEVRFGQGNILSPVPPTVTYAVMSRTSVTRRLGDKVLRSAPFGRPKL